MNDLSLKALNDSKMDINGITTSSINGNIQINGSEMNIYTHPNTHPSTMITGLATVATSGSASDISFSNANFTSTKVSDALAELFTNVSNGKSSIATAITNKGVSASSNDTFATLATKIGQIQKATGNVTAAQVLSGYTFSNSTGTNITGTMANNPGDAVTTWITFVNLVQNGSFESGSSYWTQVASSSISSSYAKFGTYSIKNTSSAAYACPTQNINYVIAGHKYYACSWTKVISIASNAVYNAFGFYNGSTWSWYTVGSFNSPVDWTFSSVIATAPSGVTQMVYGPVDHDATTFEAYGDGITIIDLTATFGAGNEPSQSQMDVVMNTIGGWFDAVVQVVKVPQGAYLTNGISGSPDLLFNMSAVHPSSIAVGQAIAGTPGTYTSDANASASQILNGQTAYVNGNKITGTMTNRSGSYQPSARTDGTYTAGRVYLKPPIGYYDGSDPYAYVYQDDANFVASNIVSGKTIFGLTGTADTTNAKLIASDNSLYYSSATSDTYSSSYTKIREVTYHGISGTLRVRYSVSTPQYYTGYFAVGVNDSLKNEVSPTPGVGQTFSLDISVNNGDRIQIWAHAVSSCDCQLYGLGFYGSLVLLNPPPISFT